VNRRAVLEKIAVSLEQLRVATNAMKHKVLRAGVQDAARPLSAARTRKILALAQKDAKAGAHEGDFDKVMSGFTEIARHTVSPLSFPKDSKRTRNLISAQAAELGEDIAPALAHRARQKSLEGRALIAGDTIKTLNGKLSFKDIDASRLTPKDREAFNRSIWLHENAELGKHPGVNRIDSHLSVRPPLQDLNIAATLRGPGAGAAQAIRDLRANDSIVRLDGFDGLNLGHERLSRHAIRRVQDSYDRLYAANQKRLADRIDRS
jgi:hypothetical protein